MSTGCFLKYKTQSLSHMCVLLTLYVLLETFSLMYFMAITYFASQPSNSQAFWWCNMFGDFLIFFNVPYVRKLDIECGNCIMFITDKSVFGLPKDVL